MKRISQLWMILTLVVFIVPSALAQVKSDYDKTADFSKYKTYTFEGWQKDSDKQMNEFDKKRILDALKSEFDSRGMTLKDSDADAAIVLYVVVDKKTSTTAYTNFTGGMGYGPSWGWGMGMGPGMGMGTATTSYSENDYNQGTLVVDMYDTEGKKLIWQGVTTKVIKSNPQKREKSIPKTIAKLMKQFPVPAQE